MTAHEPLTEKELAEIEAWVERVRNARHPVHEVVHDVPRLVADLRAARAALMEWVHWAQLEYRPVRVEQSGVGKEYAMSVEALGRECGCEHCVAAGFRAALPPETEPDGGEDRAPGLCEDGRPPCTLCADSQHHRCHRPTRSGGCCDGQISEGVLCRWVVQGRTGDGRNWEQCLDCGTIRPVERLAPDGGEDRATSHNWVADICQACGLRRTAGGHLYYRGWFRERSKKAGPCPRTHPALPPSTEPDGGEDRAPFR